MRQLEVLVPSSLTRRVFSAWSIDIPTAMEETFVGEDSYWHAWDRDRSVSLTSVVMTDLGEPVPAVAIARHFPVLQGDPVTEMPPGLLGRAAIIDTEPPAKAERALTGLLAVYGRALVVTITSDDLGWARETWRSIRTHIAPIDAPPRPAPSPPAPPPNRAARRALH
jgi:hypothetical protein